MKIAKFTDS